MSIKVTSPSTLASQSDVSTTSLSSGQVLAYNPTTGKWENQSGMAYQKPFIFTPNGWDTGWKSARSLASSQPVVVASMGDSISVGVNSTFTSSYAEQILSSLQAKYGWYGDFWPSEFGYLGPFGPWSAVQNAGSALTVYAPSGPNNIAFGAFTYSGSTTGTVNNYLQRFTSRYAHTAMDFLDWNAFSANATWQYSIDGGAGVTVTNAASGGVIRRTSITGLVNSSHTFDWGWQSANAACASVGMCTYKNNATSGIFAARFGGSGAQSVMVSGLQALSGQTFSGYPIGAQLLIYELMTNDINTNVTTAAFSQNVTQTIRAMRRASPNCSVVFVIPSYPDSAVDDVNTGLSQMATAYAWHNEIYNIAKHQCCAVVDMHAKWGAKPYAGGFMANNNVHPLAAGQNDIFTQLTAIL